MSRNNADVELIALAAFTTILAASAIWSLI